MLFAHSWHKRYSIAAKRISFFTRSSFILWIPAPKEKRHAEIVWFLRGSQIKDGRLCQSGACSDGKQLGRPKIDPAIEKRIQTQLRAGKGILKVAAECGVGGGTVQRIRREMAEVSRPFDGASAAT
jgi:hypothetical protein